MVESSSTDNAKFVVAPALANIEEKTDCLMVMLTNMREDIWDAWPDQCFNMTLHPFLSKLCLCNELPREHQPLKMECAHSSDLTCTINFVLLALRRRYFQHMDALNNLNQMC